jgi:GTP cyclohydrolase II
MPYQQYLNSKEQSILAMSQAITMLRAGLGVRIENSVVFSSETVNPLLLKQLKQHAKHLQVIISPSRANYLFNLNVTSPLQIAFADEENFLSNVSFSHHKLNKSLYACNEAVSYAKQALLLAQLANLIPTLLIIEQKYFSASAPNLEILDIEQYLKNISTNLVEAARSKIILRHAKDATLVTFQNKHSQTEHYALLIGEQNHHNPLVRLHSSCFTGDVLASLYCDCGEQLQAAIKYMSDHGGGVLLYIMQEGRGIGLVNKMRCYNLQQMGFDTVEANEILGFNKDDRDFFAAANILNQLSLNNIKLLSNNPAKKEALEKLGLTVLEMISHTAGINPHNLCYLKTKISKMGHNINPTLLSEC